MSEDFIIYSMFALSCCSLAAIPSMFLITGFIYRKKLRKAGVLTTCKYYEESVKGLVLDCRTDTVRVGRRRAGEGSNVTTIRIDYKDLSTGFIVESIEVKNMYDIGDTVRLFNTGGSMTDYKRLDVTDDPNSPNLVPENTRKIAAEVRADHLSLVGTCSTILLATFLIPLIISVSMMEV